MILKFLFRKPNMRLAFLYSMWMFHERLLAIWTPRYLYEETDSSATVFIWYEGQVLFWRYTLVDLHLLLFSCICHCLHQRETLSRSDWSERTSESSVTTFDVTSYAEWISTVLQVLLMWRITCYCEPAITWTLHVLVGLGHQVGTPNYNFCGTRKFYRACAVRRSKLLEGPRASNSIHEDV